MKMLSDLLKIALMSVTVIYLTSCIEMSSEQKEQTDNGQQADNGSQIEDDKAKPNSPETTQPNGGEATAPETPDSPDTTQPNGGGSTAPETPDSSVPNGGGSTAPETPDSSIPNGGGSTAPETPDSSLPNEGNGSAPTDTPTAPEGFSFAANQGETVQVDGAVDVAYGTGNNYEYLTGVTEDFVCTGQTFGLEFETMIVKHCFVKPSLEEPADQSPENGTLPDQTEDPSNEVGGGDIPPAQPEPENDEFQYELYSQKGLDVSWQEVLDSGNLAPLGEASKIGFQGSNINVVNSLVETTAAAKNRTQSDTLRIHTLGNSNLAQSKWQDWSRWYQIDGNTEVFRLYKGEENVSNARALAARIEAFDPEDRWLPESSGVWREFSARFTLIKAAGCGLAPAHTCSIFQAKGNNEDHWSVMIRLDGNGDVWFYPRGGEAKRLATNMEGKGFDLRVRDNGLDYQVYVDDVLRGTGQWQRTKEIGFRWGIYVGESELVDDVMILVSGAKSYSSYPPEGYVHAADVGEQVNIIGRMDIAYGAGDKFTYLLNQRESIICSNDGIGEDPAYGVKKQCFTRVSPDDSAPEGFAFLANAQEYFDIVGTMDIAWGANGQFNYRRNLVCDESCTKLTFKCDRTTFGDPAPGVGKKCYYKSVAATDGPSGYEYEGEVNSVIVINSGKYNLAWGSEGKFKYLENQTNNVTCDNSSFGGDPNVGKRKSCYSQEVLALNVTTPEPEPEPQPEPTPAPAPAPELSAANCTSDPFDANGNVSKLAITLQQATNTGKPVKLTGTYRIGEDIRIWLRKDLTVDASQAKFIGTSNLDGDMFSFDSHDSKSKECNSGSIVADVTWTGGSFDMANAKVSQVVPLREKTPSGREGSKMTGDALSFRGVTNTGYSKLKHLIVEEITFNGTKNDTDTFFEAGGDSGVLMIGALKATIRNNKFYGVRDAAVYLSADGTQGDIGGNFTIINNYVERAFDGFVSKRGADNIRMEGNVLNDVSVGLSIKRVYDGWTATNVKILNNKVNNSVRPISVERANNVTISDNEITNLGGIVTGITGRPINKYGNQYEGIALNGVQGTNLIENNSIKGISNSRKDSTTTYGIVTRFEDGRETTGEVIKNNTYQNLDSNIKRF